MFIFSVDNKTRASATFNIKGGMGYALTYTLADYGSSPGVWASEIEAVGGTVLLASTDTRASPFQPTNYTYYVYIPPTVNAIQLSFIVRQVCVKFSPSESILKSVSPPWETQ